MTADVSPEIRREHHPDKSRGRYRHINLFSATFRENANSESIFGAQDNLLQQYYYISIASCRDLKLL
jgi:hypothetical protein